MGTPPGWGLEHRASNPVSVKNLTAIETSRIVKLLRPYVPVGTKRTSKFPKIKSALKGRRFQDIEDILRKHNDGRASYCTTGVPKMFRTVTASLA
jgi:hypothetical protein